MKVGFEAKRLFKNFTGLGNYSRFVVDALSTYHKENQYILYSPQDSAHPEVKAITAKQNIEVVLPPNIYRKLKLTSIWRSWAMSQHATIETLNVYHGLSHELPLGLPSHVKKVVTVHDLIFKRYPRFYNPLDRLIYTEKVKRACRNADTIIAISKQTAEDVVQFLNVAEEKVRIVHQGCHPAFNSSKTAEQVSAVKKKYNIPNEYILNVGTIEERKNLLVILKALLHLKQEERPHLVVVGRNTEYSKLVYDFIHTNRLTSQVTLIHNVAFADLPALYQGAKLFVYPSLFEGFGIPLIESITSRVPVITSRKLCFEEAAGPYSVYADTQNAEELAVNIKRLIENDDERREIVNKSLDYIRRFDPSFIADELMRVYRC